MRIGGRGIFAGKSVLGINLKPRTPLGLDVEITTDEEFVIPSPGEIRSPRARTAQTSDSNMGRNALIFGGLAVAALVAWYYFK